ncbi:MAG TPA: ABC transporter ATP-binding protein [Terriglobia bacterium]|nr:ABC transporter ATP-binding protein [Terriglobia bacterium]
MLALRHVAKRFGSAQVLDEISLDVAQGEFLTILGASGSGKTTLLRLVAGFEQPDGGEIWMAGERLDGLPPYRRRVNTVFQHYALFPHLSVFENVAYGLRVGKAPRTEIAGRVREALAMVKMADFATRAPRQLSGGQQQRVALARALVNRPQLLLLDEPLSALDAALRREMQTELKSLQREVGIAFLFVTHDQDEAMALSDRIALLHAGRLEQVATPREIYQRPATAYTAQFVGQTNLLRVCVERGRARWGALSWRYGPRDASGAAASSNPPRGEVTVTFSLRPENIRLLGSSSVGAPGATGSAETTGSGPAGELADEGERVRFIAIVRRQVFGGSTDWLELECPDGATLLARIPSRGILAGACEFEFRSTDAVPVRPDS